MLCWKCHKERGLNQQCPEWECPHCGVIYSKDPKEASKLDPSVLAARNLQYVKQESLNQALGSAHYVRNIVFIAFYLMLSVSSASCAAKGKLEYALLLITSLFFVMFIQFTQAKSDKAIQQALARKHSRHNKENTNE